MHGQKKKVLQTELKADDYETIVNLAKRKNVTIEEAVREALLSWPASTTDLAEDSLFKLKLIDFKVKVRSDEIEAFLYERK